MGVHFDPRLTWREHIKNIVKKSTKVINVIRCLAGLTWGVDIA